MFIAAGRITTTTRTTAFGGGVSVGAMVS